MKGDFSRLTFSPRKHYSAVLMQQGRVQLDADWNEQQEINQHRIEMEARDLIGPTGGPADDAGFEIGVQDSTLSIGPGDYYVDGILCQNEDAVLSGDQNDLPGMNIVGILAPQGQENSAGLVYLDVWEQHLTALEDDHIREVALGGPDTTTRKRTVWQVRALRLEGADTTSNLDKLQKCVKEHLDLVGKLAPAPADMIAHWGFDEAGGDTVSDSSGNGNGGRLVGATRSVGKVGTGALDFDGVDDVVELNGSLRVKNTENDFTIAFWANPRAAHQIDTESTSGTSGTSGQRYAVDPQQGAAAYGSSDHACAGVSVGTNGISVYEQSTSYMPALLVHQASISDWTHVAVVYESRRPKLYVNGKLAKTGLTSPKSFVHLNPRTLGGTSNGFFRGQLDDVRVYDRALSEGEISKLCRTDLEVRDMRTRLRQVDDQLLELLKLDREGSFEDELKAAHPPSTGKLLARAVRSNSRPAPLLSPDAGYEGLENQLYRIEIHTTENKGQNGDVSPATFKWSRDNGSVVTPVLRIPYVENDGSPGTEIAVRDLGSDETLGFAPGQYVELVSDAMELTGQAGPLLRIADVDPARRTITVEETLTPISPEDARDSHYKLRRWDSDGALEAPSDGEPVEIEGGIEIEFSKDAATHYNVGDYWLIPARTATGDIEWPKDKFQPPAGVVHHRSPLALVMLATVRDQAGNAQERLLVLSDHRRLFPPLTGLTSLHYLGGDGQATLPGQTLPRPLVVGVSSGEKPVQGARVKFAVQGEEEDLASYDGLLEANGSTDKSVIVTTDARGEAKCFWTLATKAPSQQVRASLVNGSHLPIYFNATLSASEAVSESIQIDKVLLGAQELRMDTEIPTTALADGEIQLVCDETITPQTLRGKSACYVTLELPFPQSASDKALWGDALIGFQPIALAGEVNTVGTTISWKPLGTTSAWLKNMLFQKVPSNEILARLTLKGNFIFPSGDGRRGDFEMPFRLVKDPVKLNTVTLAPDKVTGQTESVTGTVNILGLAPAGGVTIGLESSDPNVASVDQDTVTIAAGQTSQTFTVDTAAVDKDTVVKITATFEQQERSAELSVLSPVLASLTITPEKLFGKSSANGTVTLTGPAPAGGASVALSSGNPIVTVPQTVNVPAGSNTNTTPFTIGTQPVGSTTPVTITASYKNGIGKVLTVLPPVLETLTLTTSTVTGGVTPQPQGTITLNADAPANFTVTLQSTDTSAATVPDNVPVPQNTKSATFTVTTKAVASKTDLFIAVISGGKKISAPLSVLPPKLTKFEFSPSKIPNASKSTGILTLNGPAPSNTVVNLSPSNTDTATIPASVNVPSNATQITFEAVGKTFTDRQRSVSVQAFYLGSSPPQPAVLTVDAGKLKEKEKEFEKDKDFGEKFALKEKEIQSFEELSVRESTKPGTEESDLERSFIRPEERPKLEQ